MENHNNDKLKIKIVTNPAENELQSPEQKKQVEILKNLNEEITELEKSIEEQNSKLVNSRVRVSELELIRDELVSMKGRFDTWQQERAAHYSQFDLDIRQMASLSVETSKVDQLIEAERKIIQNLTSLLSDDSGRACGSRIRSEWNFCFHGECASRLVRDDAAHCAAVLLVLIG